MRIRKKVLGASHPVHGISWGNVANLKFQSKNLMEAEEYSFDFVAIRQAELDRLAVFQTESEQRRFLHRRIQDYSI